MSVTPGQIRQARLLLGWSRIDLATNSAVDHVTIGKLEAGIPGRYNHALLNLSKVLESTGIEFIAESGGGAGVRLKSREMSITADNLRRARRLLGWTQFNLAAASNVGRATIADFESGRGAPSAPTLVAIRAALESAGVEFIE